MKTSPTFVAVGHLYAAEEARKRLGLGAWAWRKMRRAGLRVRYVSGRAYVSGDDLIEFICNDEVEPRRVYKE